MGDSACLGMYRGTSQFFGCDILVSDRFDHAGACDKHVRGFLHHEDEVRYGGAVDGSAGAGAHDAGNLGHHPAGSDVAVENLAVGGQRVDTFLDAGAAGIVQADDWCAHPYRKIHSLADFLGVRLTKGASHNREILAENEHFAAVNTSVTGDNTVARVVAHISQSVPATGF